MTIIKTVFRYIKIKYNTIKLFKNIAMAKKHRFFIFT